MAINNSIKNTITCIEIKKKPCYIRQTTKNTYLNLYVKIVASQKIGIKIMKFKVSFKERLYFGIMSTISLLLYCILATVLFKNPSILTTYLVAFIYIGMFILFMKLMSIILVGYIKGNAIKVSKDQFPETFDILYSQSKKLGLDEVPDMYILQGNGALNAFATRLSNTNFVVLFSDIFEIAHEEGEDAVSFIIGHELGHIKRKHIHWTRSVMTLPARFIPFLNSAYSRAREYTCDNIGYNLSPKGAISGLLILAAGKKLYKKINVSNFIDKSQEKPSISRWLAEVCSTHPHLFKRVAVINKLNSDNPEIEDINFIDNKHSVKSPEIQQ